MPTMPRTTAARLAPVTPNAMRATTGYGTPYLSDGGRSHRPVPTVWMRVMSAGKQPFRRKPRHSHERPRNFRRPALGGDAPVILYGWHTVTAALANPARRIRRLLVTENALRRLAEEGIALPLAPEVVRPDAIAARLTPDAVHQGLLAEADPLPSPDIEILPADGHRAGARPDHRSAQCRRHPAHRGGVCGRGHRHHRAPQPGGDRRAGEIRLRRAGTGADRHRCKIWRAGSPR